jgi:hypothetical protein
MFSVWWIARNNESQPILIEKGFLTTLDKVASSCRRRIPMLRLDHPDTPPDGFLIFDSDGTEVRRWFEPPEPGATIG